MKLLLGSESRAWPINGPAPTRLIKGGPPPTNPLYERMRAKAFATFTMPLKDTHVHNVEVDRRLVVLPFDVVHFVEPFRIRESATDDSIICEGVESFVLWRVTGNIAGASRLHYTNTGPLQGKIKTLYAPEQDDGYTGDQALIMLHSFNTMVRRRDMGFIEQTVSRQVRRAEGYRSTYRDYIIVGKSEPHFKYATPIRHLTKTLRDLHVVRGHFRRFWNGVELERPIPVKEHSRGQRGQLFQIKDYEVRT